MFKRITTYASALLASAMLLMACGGGNHANAAALPFNFTSTDGVNFSTEHASSVSKSGTTISVTTMAVNQDGVTVPVSTGYADSNGTVWAKFASAATSTGLFIQVGTSNRYIGAKAVKYTYCSSPISMLFYGGGTTEANEPINDNCVITQAIKALSN